MPMKMTEEEYAEMLRKSAQIRGGSGGGESRSQNIRMNGRAVPDNREIPKNQQRERDIRQAARDRQKAESEKFENKHPRAHRIIQGVKRVGSAAKAGMDRYVSSREEGQRRLSRASQEEKETYSDSWVSRPVWGSSLPKRKSKKKPSSRSSGSNDYYPVFLYNTATGGVTGGGLGMWGSSLPKKSTTTKKKKKTTTRRRR